MEIVYFFLTLLRAIKHNTISLWNSIPKLNCRVLIVGNGPSISDINLNEIKNKNLKIMCVNFFASRSKDFFNVKPDFYCCIDPELYKFDNNIIGNDEKKTLFKNLNKADWKMIFVCLKGQKPPITNKNIKVVNIPNVSYRYLKCQKFLLSHCLASLILQNVIAAGLYFCITSKVDEIYLAGVDTDWHRELIVDENNNVFRKDKHFYGIELVNVIETGEIQKGELYKYFEWYANTLKSFFLANEYAKVMGVKIYNLTQKSYIDVFEKRKLI